MMFLKDVCEKTGKVFIFCVSKRMVAMVNDKIIYTLRALGCSPENVYSLGQGKASTSPPNSFDN